MKPSDELTMREAMRLLGIKSRTTFYAWGIEPDRVMEIGGSSVNLYRFATVRKVAKARGIELAT